MSDEENNEIESEQENAAPEAEVETNEDPAVLLEDARNKADEHWNELLRARADMENMRRRQARDLENAHKHALDKFVTELLPIYDSMELGLNAANGDEASLDAVREGLEMTMKMFLSSLAKFGLEQVVPEEGDDFDPELHQAMGMTAVEGVEPNKILTVAQKGFQFNGRLLRPAMVMVSQ
jgi:molecular chaperone GrpE